MTAHRAVLFDLDGTLYAQGPLRAFMALELSLLPLRLRSIARARRVFRTILAFRRAQEALRAGEAVRPDLAETQVRVAAVRAGVAAEEVARIVDEWIFMRPLRYLRICRRRGLVDLLDVLDARGVPAAVLSDYPPAAKLEALGLADRFAFALAATDAEVGAFKPHPAGFRRACERLGLAPADVLYIGDRPEVDAAGAAAAGMPCAILPSFAALGRTLDRDLVQAGARA